MNNATAIVIAIVTCRAAGESPTKSKIVERVNFTQGRQPGDPNKYDPYFALTANPRHRGGAHYSAVVNGLIKRLPGRIATYSLTAKGRKLARQVVDNQMAILNAIEVAIDSA